MARVNPPLQEENAPYNPVNKVTGVFDAHDQVTMTLRELAEAGFARQDIDVFSGAEGEQAIDPSGDSMGAAGRFFRKLENWVSDTAKFHELAAATLQAGGFIVSAHAEGSEPRKDIAMDILTRNGARDVKFWSKFYIEQGYEDVPRQNLQREDQ